VRNAIILGCGRSGTSMVAGLAASAGYFMGPDLHPPRKANPLGFFEGDFVKAINEDLLEQVVRPESSRTNRGSRWLETLPADVQIQPLPVVSARISRLVAREPFALKDPRFCYTLSAWRPHLPDATAYVCVFREPGRTVASILQECSEAPWLEHVRMSSIDAEALWVAMYRRVLDQHSQAGDWLFVHYDQILSGTGVVMLADHLRASVDGAIVTPALKRSEDRSVGPEAKTTYQKLCTRAGFHG
jgi:hypothetical protein